MTANWRLKAEDGGGPAFPNPAGNFGLTGLTKREWYAGLALIGLCQADMGELENIISPDVLARTAVSMGDAMVAALAHEDTK